jgi:hypothetical protein
MLGEKTYTSFIRESGPFRALVATVAVLGRRQKRRREAVRARNSSTDTT